MTTKSIVLAMAVTLSLGAFAETAAELEKAFDAAYKAGEPLRADQTFRQLIEKNPKTAPVRYYQAAEVSRQLGKTTDRRTRLAHYLKVEKAWNEMTEQAAWEMCRSANDADQFTLLTAKVPASRTLFWAGVSLLDTYRNQKRSSDFKKVATALLQTFKESADREEVFSRIGGLLTDGVPGFTAEEARGYFDRFPVKDMNCLDWTMRVKRDAFSPLWRLNYMAKNQVLMTPEPYSFVWNIDYNKPEQRAEAAKCLAAIEKLALDGKHPSQAYWWYRQHLELRDQFFKPAETNKMSAAYLALFDKVVACEPKVGQNDLRDLAHWTCERALVPADRAKIPAKYPQYGHATTILVYGGLNAVCEAQKSAKPITDFLAKYPDRHDVAWDALRTMAKWGGKDAVLKEIEYRLVNSWDGRLDCWHPFYALTEIKGISDQEKADFLARVWKKTGDHQFFSFLIDDKRPRNFTQMTNKVCQAFFAGLKKGAKSSERIVEIRREMAGLNRGSNNLAPEQAHKLFAEACKVFPGVYPQPTRWDNGIFDQILGRYLDLCQHNLESAPICAQAVIDKLDPKTKGVWTSVFSWNNVCWNSRDAKDGFYCKLHTRRAQCSGDPNIISGLTYPKDTAKLPDGIDATKMSAIALGDLLRNNWVWHDGNRRYFTPELTAQLFAIWFKNYDLRKVGDWNWRADFMRVLISAAETKGAAFAAFPFDKAAADLLDKGENSDLPRWYLQFCARAGKGPQYLKRYLDAVAKLEPAGRLNALVRVGEMEDVVTYGNAEKKVEDLFTPFFKDRLLPALKGVSLKHAPLAALGSYGTLARRAYAMRDALDKAAETAGGDAAAIKAKKAANGVLLDTFFAENVRLKVNGAEGWYEDSQRGAAYYWCHVYGKAMAATNRVEMSRYANAVGGTMNPWTIGWDTMNNFMQKTRDEEQWEPLYLMVNALQNFDKDQYSRAMRFRGEASTHLPGVYPVTEKDPLYPLYVAADEFNRNNFERATALLKKSLPVFERDAVKLPPDFTAWAVEQLRLERGAKDAMLVKARAIATQLLTDESKITPELAAAMMLVKAECYRDQQNFEAAKLEYQTIRNSPVYSKTKAGRKAMYRAIDLMIDTGNAGGAESTLEYWLSQPDPEVQAQAHYFLARIAFERKDYEECRKQLREVFSINFTHTEGRFLEGKWKLATGSEVDDTEVMIGKLADRTMIRPGQQLSISVQDRNLSVAGGGASIPVVITTTPGNDRERIYLYPSPRDPTLFKGVIDVKLAATVVSNLTLEVTGNDSASYVIDPEFLKARGLPLNAPKKLRVVDDARLVIGAGAPRTDEQETKDRLEAIVAGGEDSGYHAALRPGNPLYIAVMDKDRSLGGDGEITVSVSTTSGDKLENVTLKETGPYTGIFRGEVPTQLPPPRAYASDTAVGYNPGDVINSGRTGEWKSLSDGGRGKWFAVDTMASHVLSNITFKMSAPEEINAVRLSGRIGKTEMVLGSFPARKVNVRTGILRQEEWNLNARGEQAIKAYFDSPKAPKTTTVTNLAYTMKYERDYTRTVYMNGAFAAPVGYDHLRFRLAPKTTVGETFKRLWISVYIDGTQILTGNGESLVNRIVTYDIEPGVHSIVIYSTQVTGDDSWELLWEPVGENARPLPAELFDSRKHPEILDYLADKATIERTKEGFVATMKGGVRLRTFKLDFLDRVGPDVQLSAVSATDIAGKAVLPVESDFSDAQKNDKLEVAPGDSISVRYTDEATTSGESRILTKSIHSSFNDASIGFYFEEVVTTRNATESILHSAYRFVPGDMLLVGVSDPDLDLTEEADQVTVTVTSRTGEERKVRLVEQSKYFGGVNMGRSEETEGVHSGFFLGLLKTCPADKTNVTGKAVMKCGEGEVLRLSYEDRENTNPGVPFVRTASVAAAKTTDPMLTLFHTRVKRVVDTSADAKAKLALLKRRAGNEKVEKLFTDVVSAIPMNRSTCNSTNLIPVNVAAPMPIRVNDPSRARHEASYLVVEAVSESELKRAEADGDDPDVKKLKLRLGAEFGVVKLLKGGESAREARTAGSFNGVLNFAVGGIDPNAEGAMSWSDPDSRPVVLPVTGSDRVNITVKDAEGNELLKRSVKLVSNANLGLLDSSWTAERTAAHVGERFFVRVEDPDRDATDEADRIEVDVKTTAGVSRKIVLAETLPHSGVFAGTVRPVIFLPKEEIPGVVTGAQATAEQLLAEDRLAVKYGDSVLFHYADDLVLPGTKPRTLCVTGLVHKGANGDVRLFSKRFRDSDQAVLVQFRLAECLFEQAKDHRKLKHKEKSAEAIAKGRAILEEALKNNPESAHVAQGEFLLANLYQELAAEEKQNGDKNKAKQLYAEALARFSSILAVWPEGDYAARSQYHKAYCLEMLEDYKLAGEEYVKMTYLYPESPLVGDATIRLATYYYRQEKKYSTAARIYENFARRFPQHDKAPRSLFMCGSCYIKEAERIVADAEKAAKEWAEKHNKEYQKGRGIPSEAADMYTMAVRAFVDMGEKYRATTTPELRAQALYWAGDASLRKEAAKDAYLFLKRTVLEYPETEWARRARGLLLQNGKAFKGID